MSQSLSVIAQTKIDELHKFTAQAYGGKVGQKFSATPTIAQTLNEKIIEDGNWFLRLINVLPVSEISGEKVLLGLSGNVSGRTDTSSSGERVAKNLVDLDNEGYTLKKTDSDVALRYATIDAWAKFKNFVELYSKAVRQAIGNDRVKVGFVGTSAAATTTEPDLSDVNIGWLQKIRVYNAGAQYVLGTAPTEVDDLVTVEGSVTLGSATFPNLDSLVYSALNNIEVPFQDDPDLVVLVGRNVMQHAKGAYFDKNGNTPTEKAKVNERVTVDTYGGLPAYVPPYFDANSILVTSLNNLSIYWQETSWRRQQIDNPKKDQYEDFNSRNEGYVVEQLGKTSLVQGIEYRLVGE